MELILDDRILRIQLTTLEKVLSIKRSFEIPLTKIITANTDPPKTSMSDMRAAGTNLPRVIKAGTYYTKRGMEFWYVIRGKGYLTVELKDHTYKRIVLGIDRNEYWAYRINKAIQ